MTTEMNKKTAIRGSKEKLPPTHLSIRSDFLTDLSMRRTPRPGAQLTVQPKKTSPCVPPESALAHPGQILISHKTFTFVRFFTPPPGR